MMREDMGVFYLLAYIVGGVIVAFAAHGTITNLAEGAPVDGALTILSFGVLLILCGGVLHTIQVKGERDEDTSVGPPMALVYIALALLVLPVLVAWVQFELHINPLWMFPITTILGATGFVYLIAWRRTLHDKFGPVKRAMATAMVGLPLGLFAIGAPLVHFKSHLTTVNLGFSDDPSEPRIIAVEAPDPDPPIAPIEPIGDETMELMKAIAEAKPVNIADEVAAGRMRVLEDGTLVTVHEDGTTTPINQGFDFDEAWEEAERHDRNASRDKREAQLKAHAEEVERLREGGRLFSGSGQ